MICRNYKKKHPLKKHTSPRFVTYLQRSLICVWFLPWDKLNIGKWDLGFVRMVKMPVVVWSFISKKFNHFLQVILLHIWLKICLTIFDFSEVNFGRAVPNEGRTNGNFHQFNLHWTTQFHHFIKEKTIFLMLKIKTINFRSLEKQDILIGSQAFTECDMRCFCQ